MEEKMLERLDSIMNLVVKNSNLLSMLKEYYLNNPDVALGSVFDMVDVIQDVQKECKDALYSLDGTLASYRNF